MGVCVGNTWGHSYGKLLGGVGFSCVPTWNAWVQGPEMQGLLVQNTVEIRNMFNPFLDGPGFLLPKMA